MSASALTEPRRAADLLAMLSRPSRVLAILLAAILMYWVWYGVTQRSIIEDEGISILAAQGILEYGIPILPSSSPYHRGYIPHYLESGAILVLGLNDFSIILPSLLMALGSLILIYLLARDALKRPWVGVLAVAILLTINVQTFYATSPRFYMGLQFFTMLAVYSAWRGYASGERKFRWVFFLAVCAALLSSRIGAGLVISIPLSVVIVVWLKDRVIPKPAVAEIVGALIVAAVGYFLFQFTPSGTIDPVIDYAGVAPPHALIGINYSVWLDYFRNSKLALIFAVSFAPVLLYAATHYRDGRMLATNYGLVFISLFLAFSIVLVLFNVSTPGVRVVLNLLPILSLIVAASIVGLIMESIPVVRILTSRYVSTNTRMQVILTGAGALAAGLAILLTAIYLFGPQLNAIARASMPPCSTGSWQCQGLIESHYIGLRGDVGSNDIIVSTNPWVTSYYLGRVDGILRERIIDEDTFASFDSPTDEYFGVPIIDSIEELDDLFMRDERVWVFTDPKMSWALSVDTKNHLVDTFCQVRSDPIMTTYVNC